MSFLSILRDRTPQINEKENKYKQGLDLWNQKLFANSNILKVMTLVTISAVIMSFSMLITLNKHLKKPKYIPYLVTVNQNGDYEYQGIATRKREIPELNNQLIQSTLRKWIKNIRIIYSDEKAVKDNLSEAWMFMSSSGQQQFIKYVKDTQIIAKAGTVHTDVIFRIYEKVGENTWRVEWKELSWNAMGEEQDYKIMSITIGFDQIPVNSEEVANINPLGISIKHFSIKEERI